MILYKQGFNIGLAHRERKACVDRYKSKASYKLQLTNYEQYDLCIKHVLK